MSYENIAMQRYDRLFERFQYDFKDCAVPIDNTLLKELAETAVSEIAFALEGFEKWVLDEIVLESIHAYLQEHADYSQQSSTQQDAFVFHLVKKILQAAKGETK